MGCLKLHIIEHKLLPDTIMFFQSPLRSDSERVKYVKMKEVISELSNNGFTATEEAAKQKAAQQKLEHLQLIWGTMK